MGTVGYLCGLRFFYTPGIAGVLGVPVLKSVAVLTPDCDLIREYMPSFSGHSLQK